MCLTWEEFFPSRLCEMEVTFQMLEEVKRFELKSILDALSGCKGRWFLGLQSRWI